MSMAPTKQHATPGAFARAGPEAGGAAGHRVFTAIELPHQSIAGADSHEG